MSIRRRLDALDRDIGGGDAARFRAEVEALTDGQLLALLDEMAAEARRHPERSLDDLVIRRVREHLDAAARGRTP